jgi:molybdenum cofactor cytidylyltransferase
LPADLPLISPETILSVAQALQAGAQAAYPEHAGQRGHPVGFAKSARDELMNLKGNQGAALILCAREAMKLIVKDAGCVMDIDTLEQLEAARLLASEC